MTTFNIYDEVVVLLQNNFYHALVAGNMGEKVHIIVKEKRTSQKGYLRDSMYDREYFVSEDRIVQKTYDAKTDRCLAE
jgi:hypothetical protein